MEYKTVRGVVITEKMLRHYEDISLGETKISEKLGLSRMGLWKIRKKMGVIRRHRCDKGILRKDPEEIRLARNKYHREYRKRMGNPGHAVIRVNEKCTKRSRHNATFVIGRILMEEEVVHHIDENVRNDSYNNLMVFANQRDHLAYHRGEDIKAVEAEIL